MAPRPEISSLSEILRRRGVDRIAYFHTDHFEPWRILRDRPQDSYDPSNADDVLTFVEKTSQLWYAKRLSLFYWPSIGRVIGEREGTLRVPGDSFGLIPRNDQQAATCRRAMHGVAASEHEIQLHFHHEYITPNAKYCFQYPDHAAYFVNPENSRFHSARYDLALQLTLDQVRGDSGIALPEWFFVHGMWALNASDLDVCTITDEIERMMKLGCRGDFTFPAGRSHCDPSTYREPTLVKPVTAVKGYDSPAARAEPAWSAGAATAKDRFFIWADPVPTTDESIDYYSSAFDGKTEDTPAWAARLLEASFVVGGTLYFKTHAHSMFHSYFADVAVPIHPHEHPAVQALFDLIGEAASAAGCSFDLVTVSELYDEFLQGGLKDGAKARVAGAA